MHWKIILKPCFFPSLSTPASLPDSLNGLTWIMDLHTEPVNQTVQHRSADRNIYQSTLTKAHFTNFPHFLFFLALLLPIAKHLQIEKGIKQSSGFVLPRGLGCMFSLAWKLTKGIGGIHQKEVILDISHYTNVPRLFCITNGLPSSTRTAFWIPMSSVEYPPLQRGTFLIWLQKHHN